MAESNLDKARAETGIVTDLVTQAQDAIDKLWADRNAEIRTDPVYVLDNTVEPALQQAREHLSGLAARLADAAKEWPI